MPRALLLAAVVLISPLTASAQQKTAKGPDLKALDAWITSAMNEWKIPGVAVGIVQDGKVVVAKGYGYRNLEEKLPVTEKTILAIGSNTKSFTVVLMGKLVDQGKLDWEKPVRDYLPDFRLYDPYATREMTPRDLVSHSSGLPRHDLLWYGRGWGRKDIYQRLQYLEPTTSYRGRFQYQNLMYITAGYLTEQLTGKSWEQQLQDEIFGPLGMTRTNTSVTQTQKTDDFSYPYTTRDSAVVRIPFRQLDAAGPAGSINSSVEDMLKYVQMRDRLGDGRRQAVLLTGRQHQDADARHRGERIRGQRSLRRHRPHDLRPRRRGDQLPGPQAGDPRRRHRRVPVPDVVAAERADRRDRPHQLDRRQRREHHHLSRSTTPSSASSRWTGSAGRRPRWRGARPRRTASARRGWRSGSRGHQPSHALADYAGTYEHPGYGQVIITSPREAALELQFDTHKTALNHFHYDVFEIPRRPDRGADLGPG